MYASVPIIRTLICMPIMVITMSAFGSPPYARWAVASNGCPAVDRSSSP